MSFRSRLALAGSLALALVVGACGDGDGDGSSDETSATTTAPAPSTSAPPTSSAGSTTTIAAAPPEVDVELVAELDQPVALEPVPEREGVFYVVEKEGRLRLLDLSDGGDDDGEVVLDIVESVSSGGERGLLGLAVAPDGGHLYLDYTDREGDTRIVEYAIGADGRPDPDSRRELLLVDQPYANHNGGHLAFGPDGHLYIALGDGGSGGDPHDNGQRLDTLLGKILRIDPDGDPYAIPAGNPFAGRDGVRPEIWAYGLRNPWRFSFDRSGGTLWIGDVGQNSREEIDRSPVGSSGGENYGWNRFEGREPFEGTAPAEHVLPLFDYPTGAGSCAVTGGHVYRGAGVAGLQGWYLFGDYCKGDLLALASDTAAPAKAVSLGVRVPSLVSFADDGTGELFALSLQGGVYRIVPG